jgi:gamma-glutamyltranspeptidase
MSALSKTQEIRKHVIQISGGVVAARYRLAAEAGADDLADYRAWMGSAQTVPYRDALFHVMPELTAGPTFAHVMKQLKSADLSTQTQSYPAYADALRRAYTERLNKMGHTGEVPEAFDCTTHFSIVDRACKDHASPDHQAHRPAIRLRLPRRGHA